MSAITDMITDLEKIERLDEEMSKHEEGSTKYNNARYDYRRAQEQFSEDAMETFRVIRDEHKKTFTLVVDWDLSETRDAYAFVVSVEAPDFETARSLAATAIYNDLYGDLTPQQREALRHDDEELWEGFEDAGPDAVFGEEADAMFRLVAAFQGTAVPAGDFEYMHPLNATES